jgi:hypothetical protein
MISIMYLMISLNGLTFDFALARSEFVQYVITRRPSNNVLMQNAMDMIT